MQRSQGDRAQGLYGSHRGNEARLTASQVDRQGHPISIKLRKEEVKRSKEQLASGEKILQKQIM